MKRNALILMLIMVVSKIFGFGREITLAYLFGVSNISDAYLISITIPNVIFGFIGSAIVAGFIPIYNNIIKKDGEEKAHEFTSNLINILILLVSIMILICLFFTQEVVKLFASGFDEETLKLTVNFTQISLFAIYFTTIVSVFTGYLQIKNNYFIPAIVGIASNVVIIASIYYSSKYNIILLSVGFVISNMIQLLFMIKSIKRTEYKHKLLLNFKDENIRKMGYISAPMILGISVNQINILVDRTIASQVSVGGVSALNYANRVNGLVHGIFILSIITAQYPVMSKMSADNNIKGIKKTLSESINAITLVVTPISIGAMFFANPIITLFFARGEFDVIATSITSYALYFYSIGMLGFGLRDILSRVFYSLQDTKTPMANAVIGLILNIVLNVYLSRYMGIGGIALATSISAIFTTILLLISLRKKMGPFGMKQISISFLKILFASLVMGGLAKLSFNYLTATLSQNLSLLLAIGVGAVSYFVIIYFMKIEDVDVIVGAIKKKLGRGAA